MNYEPQRQDLQGAAVQKLNRRAQLRLVLLVGVPLLAVLGAGFAWLQGGRYVSTENAYVRADIAQVSSEVPGRVQEILVRDHAAVLAGDVLLRLDAAPYQLALVKADAELDAARAAVAQLKASLRETKAEYTEAESRLEFFDVQASRQKGLSGRGVSPVIKFEQAESEARQARDRMSVLRERIARVEASLGSRPDADADTYAVVREKKALRDRAALDLANTAITAPSNGTIVNLRMQLGEQIKAQTPLFSLVVTRAPWVDANFKETDLSYVAVGQPATVVLDIYPGTVFQAVVESISPATGAEFAVLPPQNASGNWVKVVQRLPVRLRLIAPDASLPLRSGMTATVSIDTGRQRSLLHVFGEATPPRPH